MAQRQRVNVDGFPRSFKRVSSERYRIRIPHLSVACQLPSKAGFTLLELLVVIFVLSLVLAVSLPSFTGIGESKIQSDAKRLASILRYLNDSAISTKESLYLKINLQDKTIHYNGPDGEKTETFDTLSGIELQSKGMISAGEVIIPFGSLGASESLQFRLKNDQQDIVIDLNAMSGRVRIRQNEKT